MGQKVHPVGMRLGITSDWDSNWFAEKDFQAQLLTDIKVRKYLFDNLKEGAISHIKIERPAKNARIKILAGKPGAIIGQKGKGVEKLRDEASRIMGVPVHLTIEEVRKPELDAFLVADNVARQLEQRVMFRRAMKRAVQSALRSGALGVKICVSGRLGGAEIARSEWTREGRVPLHTFRAEIDYALAEALTTYGIIGVKVWIFKGEKVAHAPKKIEEKVE
jgi:small subunit ribosomal protein S3